MLQRGASPHLVCGVFLSSDKLSFLPILQHGTVSKNHTCGLPPLHAPLHVYLRLVYCGLFVMHGEPQARLLRLKHELEVLAKEPPEGSCPHTSRRHTALL